MIPGIGPVMAARIIAARPFRSADDLKKVSGIGEKKYTQNPSVFSVALRAASHAITSDNREIKSAPVGFESQQGAAVSSA